MIRFVLPPLCCSVFVVVSIAVDPSAEELAATVEEDPSTIVFSTQDDASTLQWIILPCPNPCDDSGLDVSRGFSHRGSDERGFSYTTCGRVFAIPARISAVVAVDASRSSTRHTPMLVRILMIMGLVIGGLLSMLMLAVRENDDERILSYGLCIKGARWRALLWQNLIWA